MKTRREALKLATEVAKQLGPPWKPDVWENLGWHASVECYGGYVHPAGGGLSMYIYDHGRNSSYSVMGIDRTLSDGRTPRAAVRAAHATLSDAAKEVGRLMVPLCSAMKAGKPKGKK